MTVSIHFDAKRQEPADYLDGVLKKAKAHVASFTDIDPCFEFAGVEEGIEIWRIENLKLVGVERSKYGDFYDGDCYVVLVTTTTHSGKVMWNLHYWRGNNASIDKAFVCAIKACELHRQLRHQTRQHREVQGQESELFKQYFTKIRILPGGTPSALKIMKKSPMVPRLFQLKGPRGQVVVKQVNPHYSSLNSGDIFVLEMEDVIFQWAGKQCNLGERATALEFTTHLKLFRPKAKKVEFLHEAYGESSSVFWSALKGRPRTVKSRSEGGSDKAYVLQTTMDLYSIHESKTTGLQVSLVETRFMPTPKKPTIRQPNKHILASQIPQPVKVRKFQNLKEDSMYLLDCDLSLLLWYGKRASAAARASARKMATESIEKFNRPSWVPIIKVLPPNPAPEFWINFTDRHRSCVLPVFGPDESIQTITVPPPMNLVTAQKKLTTPRALPSSAAGSVFFEDTPGSGELLIWRVDKFLMVQVTKGNEGLFNSGYSYIIIYSHWHKKSLCHMVYYWEGKNRPCGSWLTWKWDLSPQLIKGLEKATGGIPPTCTRLVQDKETEQFYSLFASQSKQLIMFNSLLPLECPKLFTVCGFEEKLIVGREVKCCASTLSSGQASVLLCDSSIFIWCGTYANQAERQVAERVCERLRLSEDISRESVLHVEEGQEPAAFWEAIGGKKKYWKFSEREGHHRTKTSNPQPRVFRCVHSEKTLLLDELTQYSDQDLEERELFVVLAYGKVYLWRGTKVTTYEEMVACSLVGRYLEQTNTARVDFLKERSGAESLAFRSLFGKWDAPRVLEDPYKHKMEALYELGIIGREVPVQPRSNYPLKSIEERSWWLRPTHVPR